MEQSQNTLRHAERSVISVFVLPGSAGIGVHFVLEEAISSVREGNGSCYRLHRSRGECEAIGRTGASNVLSWTLLEVDVMVTFLGWRDPCKSQRSVNISSSVGFPSHISRVPFHRLQRIQVLLDVRINARGCIETQKLPHPICAWTDSIVRR